MRASQAGRREGDGAAATAAQKAAESADQAVDEANSRFDKAGAALRDLRIRRLETLEQEVAVTGSTPSGASSTCATQGKNRPVRERVDQSGKPRNDAQQPGYMVFGHPRVSWHEPTVVPFRMHAHVNVMSPLAVHWIE
jgi:hypothetical protein